MEPFPYLPILQRVLNSATAAIHLSYILHIRNETQSIDNSLFISKEQLMSALLLTRKEYDKAMDNLCLFPFLGVVKEEEGCYFQIDQNALDMRIAVHHRLKTAKVEKIKFTPPTFEEVRSAFYSTAQIQASPFAKAWADYGAKRFLEYWENRNFAAGKSGKWVLKLRVNTWVGNMRGLERAPAGYTDNQAPQPVLPNAPIGVPKASIQPVVQREELGLDDEIAKLAAKMGLDEG
jgi:hypothetical protein